MAITTFSVTFPDELIEDAKEVAEMIGNTRSLPSLKVEQTASLFRGWREISF